MLIASFQATAKLMIVTVMTKTMLEKVMTMVMEAAEMVTEMGMEVGTETDMATTDTMAIVTAIMVGTSQNLLNIPQLPPLLLPLLPIPLPPNIPLPPLTNLPKLCTNQHHQRTMYMSTLLLKPITTGNTP